MIESLLWYSRYSVWVGAIVLFIQSVTGRSVGAISVLGVLLLAVGLAAFLGALSWEGMSRPVAVEPPEPIEVAEPVLSPLPAAPATKQAPPPPAAAVSTPVMTLQTQRLDTESPLVGASCAVCAKRLRAGQVILRCPECGAVQHASCWTDNGFACAVDDCSGRGSLAAPS